MDRTFLLGKILSYVQSGNEKFSLGAGSNIIKYQRLEPLLIDKLYNEFNGEEILISKKLLKKHFRSYLNTAKNTENPKDYVNANIADLKDIIYTQKVVDYEIYFPLNISTSKPSSLKEISVIDNNLTNQSRTQWREKIKYCKEEDKVAGKHIEELDLPISSQFSYWMFQTSARDEYFAIQELNDLLQIVLGVINLAAYGYTHSQRWTKNSHLYGTSNITMPPVGLVYESDKYATCYCSEDESPRQRNSLNAKKFERAKKVSSAWTQLEITNSLKHVLERSLRFYQKGITSANNEDAFLHFWRGLESITLQDNQKPQRNLLEKIQDILHVEDEPVLKEQLKYYKNVRNDLVHGNNRIELTDDEKQTIRNWLEGFLEFYITALTELSLEKDSMEFVLNHVGKSKESLNQQKKVYRRRIDILEKLLQNQEENP